MLRSTRSSCRRAKKQSSSPPWLGNETRRRAALDRALRAKLPVGQVYKRRTRHVQTKNALRLRSPFKSVGPGEKGGRRHSQKKVIKEEILWLYKKKHCALLSDDTGAVEKRFA